MVLKLSNLTDVLVIHLSPLAFILCYTRAFPLLQLLMLRFHGSVALVMLLCTAASVEGY